MSIVKLAKQEILATMDIAEELKKPLPLEYFFLLDKKMREGITIKRLAFGTVTQFEIFNKKYKKRKKKRGVKHTPLADVI